MSATAATSTGGIDAGLLDPAVTAGAAPARASPVGIVWAGFSVAALSTAPADTDFSITYRVQFSGPPSAVRLDLVAGGSVDLADQGGDLWSADITVSQALAGYDTADVNHDHVGYLQVYEGGIPAFTYQVFINVADDRVPTLRPALVSGTIQSTCHVVNVWRPDLTFPPSAAVVRAAVADVLAAFGDQFDFLNVVHTLPSYPLNRGHLVVRNAVAGIGLPPVDDTAQWGSAGRLLGLTFYPIDTFFDLAESASLHELGHQWINYSSLPLLAVGTPHWRPGTPARGLMGFNIGGGGGGVFPFELVPLGGNLYQLSAAEPPREFTDLDLYEMGFLPPDSVGTHVVFDDPNLFLCDGCSGAATTFGVADVIAAQGPRVPAAAQSPHRFQVGTIVLSRDRLLTAAELSVFDYFAARGEATTPLPFTSGLESGVTRPFRLATRGIGTLETWMDAACASAAVTDARPAGPAFRIAGANPLRGATAFEWTQTAPARVALEVFAVTGARVARIASGPFEPGTHAARWAPGALPAGVYFVTLSLDQHRAAVRRVVVMR